MYSTQISSRRTPTPFSQLAPVAKFASSLLLQHFLPYNDETGGGGGGHVIKPDQPKGRTAIPPTRRTLTHAVTGVKVHKRPESPIQVEQGWFPSQRVFLSKHQVGDE